MGKEGKSSSSVVLDRRVEIFEDEQLQISDSNRLVETEHQGKRHVIAGGPWRKERDRERREVRIAKAETALAKLGEVTRILRELQTIRLGQISVGPPGTPLLARITKVPKNLNLILSKLNLLHLFATPPKWAQLAEPTQV